MNKEYKLNIDPRILELLGQVCTRTFIMFWPN